ncbi:MAG TPA: YbaL family putative K(+) efflux transporter [Gemmatimonadaceae bacterium]|nr:YbaL family putative K(+) efflux transporter [Gemmatimonadaceae bacterium]
MPHETGLITILAAGFGLAFILGLVATRLRLPPLVGYLVAGVIIGPSTPGFVADASLASQLAEIGVILLMFGVGLHFSVADLFAVRKIAVPGAVAQITAATALGALVAHFWGWSWGAGIVFGLSLSVASTVVLLRALEERGILDTAGGKIAVGWLIVEDLATVLALVLLPALASTLGASATTTDVPTRSIGMELTLTFVKVGAFLALMYFVGRRTVPWLLARVARTGSRELFTLAVLAVALGIAVGAASLFGVSFALGAFFAGVVIAESDLSYQAASDALPLQDAFAVLFFVSVGMLFDPMVIVEQPLHVLSVVLIIMIGKSLAAFGIMIAFRKPVRTALLISASLAQIGEFSFILAGLGITLGLLPAEANSLILAGALLTITLNPVTFATIPALERWLQRQPRFYAFLEKGEADIDVSPADAQTSTMRDHVVLIGFGRVGRRIGYALERSGIQYVAVERDQNTVEALRKRGIPAVFGDAARPGILNHVHLETAKLLVIASPDPYHARAIVELALKVNPSIEIAARTHSEAGQKFLEERGVHRAFMGERELALSMAHHSMMRMGQTDDQADATVDAMRRATSLGMKAIDKDGTMVDRPSADEPVLPQPT